MRTGMCALRAAGVVAVLAACPVGVAQAADHGGGLTVSPDAVRAGAEVQLSVSGCKGTSGRVSAEVFVAAADLTPSADRPTLFGEARVSSTARAGTYDVDVSCDGARAKVKGAVHVLARGDGGDRGRDGHGRDDHGQGDHEQDDHNRDGDGHESASPVAPVHAGGGGTAPLAGVAPEEAGPGTRQTVFGLVLAAVAAVAVALRSARRHRRGAGSGPDSRGD